jgi:hypothetical protein
LSHCPYQEITEDSFAADAAATFSVTVVTPGTAELAGPCPRCGTSIKVPVVDGIYKAFHLWRRPDDQPAPDSRLEPVICTCDDDHPGRPEGKVGCGAYWMFCLETAAE